MSKGQTSGRGHCPRLLTDLARNLLAEFYHYALAGTRLETYGLKRIVRGLLAIPGRLLFERDRLPRVNWKGSTLVVKSDEKPLLPTLPE